ncbi:hypothetical protein LINPERPRIM_LOCUS22674 [Linum perenne]
MEGVASLDSQEWEVLTHSDTEAVFYPDNPSSFEEIEADSSGVIRLDYFSIHNNTMLDDGSKVVVASGGSDVETCVESDNPTWIDPALHTRNESENSAEFLSDSGNDRSDGREVGDFELRNELGTEEIAKTGLGSDGDKDVNGREFDHLKDGFSSCEVKSEVGFDENVKSQLGFEEFKENKSYEGDDVSKTWSDSGCEDLVLCDASEGGSSLEASSEAQAAHGNDGVEETSIVESGGDEEKKQVVWWKIPFELFKFCVFKVSPVWTFSIAAAVMGFVILGRKLYKMKRKARSIELKVTVDDKKVSQFMSRAARLNEAFSVVRRVPNVRAMVPGGGGVSPWPVMNMR